jgi:acetylglutamate kinase
MRPLGLLESMPYLRAYSGQTFVVKAGGELYEKDRFRDAIAQDVSVLHRLGIKVVLVHGGGPQLDREAERLGLVSERIAGRRVTSPSLRDVAIHVWRGEISAGWVLAMSGQGERAVGLCGADGGLIKASRRPNFGEVGDVTAVDCAAIHAVHAMPAIPVVSPLALGAKRLLNVNADTVAAELAIALGAAKLILLTTAPGILSDPNDPRSVLHWTDLRELDQMRQSGALKGGMLPKVDALRRALEAGVPRVHVVDGRQPGSLLEEVFTTSGSGTLVVAEADATPAELRAGAAK